MHTAGQKKTYINNFYIITVSLENYCNQKPKMPAVGGIYRSLIGLYVIGKMKS